MWAPAVGGQLFNVLFGVVYDKESKRQGKSETCYGPSCFKFTFFIGAVLAAVSMLVLSFTIFKKKLFKKQSI